MDSNLDPSELRNIGVYFVQNRETGQLYVGSGILNRRKRVHERLLEEGTHWNYKLQQAYNANPNFEFTAMVVDGETEEARRELALDIEQCDINDLQGPFLLNIATNVEKPMTGYKHSEESIEKNRVAATERWRDPSYRKFVTARQSEGWQTLSAEDKEAFSKKRSDSLHQQYANGRPSTKGQTRSQEFVDNNSEQIKAKWQDPTYRERQLEARRNSSAMAKLVKKVIGDGVEYASAEIAAQSLGVSRSLIAQRARDPKCTNWHYQD